MKPAALGPLPGAANPPDPRQKTGISEVIPPPQGGVINWAERAAYHPYKAIFPERTHDAPPLAFCSSRPAYPHRTGDAWLLLQD